jgi:membrane protease YdiL (CAAX protease family)
MSSRFPGATFLCLTFGIAWLLWLPGLILSHGRLVTFGPFGVFSPAIAGMIVSYRGQRGQARLLPRLAWFAGLTAACFAILCAFHQQFTPDLFAQEPRPFLVLLAAVPAWIASGAFSRDSGVSEFLRTLVHPSRWGWQVIAFGCFAVYLAGPAAIASLLGVGVAPPNLQGSRPDYQAAFPLALAHGFFFTGGVSEEPGWRGFLLPRLQRTLSPLASSVLVWVPWALWHAPLDYTEWTSVERYLMRRVVYLFPLTVLMTWLYNRSGRTILSGALFHVAFNTFPDYLPSVPGTTWLLYLWAGSVVLTDRMWRGPVRDR